VNCLTVEERVVPDWMKLPVALQHQFFEQAEAEAQRCKRRLLERAEKLQLLKRHLKIEVAPKDDAWQKWRVGVVDGSNSPMTSERLGSRYGAYCAGYMIFQGRQQIEEGYRPGSFLQDQVGSQDVAQKLLTMLRVKLEREVALECLKHKEIDLLLIDGSFFGFRADASVINREVIDYGGYDQGKELTEDVRDLTLEILRSGKAVGVIKRTRSNAIDGWLISKYGNLTYCLNCNDKYILSSVLPPRHWFAYEWLFGNPLHFNYYIHFRTLSRRHALEEGRVNVQKLYQSAVERTNTSILQNLGCDHAKILCTARHFVRCSSIASPFEFEAHINTDVKPMLPYFLDFHNPATGLPWPIDLIDSNASLPRGFTKEFVEEIEARLIRDPELSDKAALLEYFSYLNPQKEED